MLNDKLLKTALIGTAQSPPVPVDPQEDIELPEQQFDHLSEESQFLLRSARCTIYEAAGRLPQQVPALPTAPDSTETAWSSSFLDLFAIAFQSEYQVVLPEFLRALADNRLQVPYRFLPKLFELKVPFAELDALVGPRGEWLSQFHPDWNWEDLNKSEEIEDLNQLTTIWNEGEFAERVAALESLRIKDPTAGRDLLSETLKKEKAENRKLFLEVLSTGLSDEDSAFLDQAMSDRSKFVKQTAANLLAKLTTSQVYQRHLERAGRFIQKKDAAKSMVLVCLPPTDLDDHWETDGLAVKSATSRGQRAFWTEELVSKMRLSYWEERFEATAVELINGILNDNYAHAVITGWTRALSEEFVPDEQSQWVDSLWKYWAAMLQHPQQAVAIQAIEQLDLLASRLPPERLDYQLLQVIAEQHDPASLPISMMIKWLPDRWSKKFSHEYIKISRTLTATRSDRASYNWLQSLSIAALSLSPDLFEAALTPWKIRDHDASAWQIAGVEKLVMNFQERIQLRSRFHTELKTLVDNR